MQHRPHILNRIDPASQRGIEIGPLTCPQILKDEGEIYYVDRASTEEIRGWYANAPTVNLDDIVPIDFVWGEETLLECTGEKAPFDYVVACHVLEHIPNLYGWLREIAAVLRPGGIAAFAIPDKRYTFDYLRAPTTPAETAEAFLLNFRKPSARMIFDHFSLHAEVDLRKAWEEGFAPGELKPSLTDAGFPLFAARQMVDDNLYVDTHCTVCTPFTFLELIDWASRLGWFDFRLLEIKDTERMHFEFYVQLEKLDPALDPAARHQIWRESLAAALSPEHFATLRLTP
jgi:SAM-dependent methyltransferase